MKKPIQNSLADFKEIDTNKDTEIFATLLTVIYDISGARDRLIIIGKDKLTVSEWIVILFLAVTLIFSIFYLKEDNLTSIIFTGSLSSVVVVLILVIQDLNDLSFGEENVSFEPYQKIFYLKKDIKSGRAHIPSGKEYITD